MLFALAGFIVLGSLLLITLYMGYETIALEIGKVLGIAALAGYGG